MGKNEKIHYANKDEIGGLVQEYNRMVDELAMSVELLAKSERESAWREMARQIAHEIKNPLTPMRLSIQQLQRTWNDKTENRDEYIKKFTNTLIEQIDNLAAIAIEFSDFAKMPLAQNVKIDMVQMIDRLLNLYKDVPHDIRFIHDDIKELYIMADQEQIRRVLINLVNNSIQAIPAQRKGQISIILNQTENKAIIKVKDNGSGIEPEIQNRLFQPNFTTKSAGSGLGLAIVKNIIEQAGGKIYFESQPDVGSEFIIELERTLQY
jgi:nitrogen fixation/metabolism regulation signal transduction histidine kinase